jgi:hypothetical protein
VAEQRSRSISDVADEDFREALDKAPPGIIDS